MCICDKQRYNFNRIYIYMSECLNTRYRKTNNVHAVLQVKVVAKNVSCKTDVSCDIGHTCQGIIQTNLIWA